MIISHKHKFIFLKTSKTAGTSVEMLLSSFSGLDAVITPLIKKDEEFRHDLFGVRAQNYRGTTLKERIKKFLGKRGQFYNHISGSQVRAIVGEEVWSSYRKVCIVRNPWGRALSFYHWRNKEVDSENSLSFVEFLNSEDGLPRLNKNGWGIYTEGDEVIVDTFIRYESLEKDLKSFLNDLGVKSDVRLPKAKAGYRSSGCLGEKLTLEEVDYIRRNFSKEIILHGYAYEGS